MRHCKNNNVEKHCKDARTAHAAARRAAMAGDARRLDYTGSFSGMRHARPRHGLVSRGARRTMNSRASLTICPQAKQILDGDVPSATLTDIVEPWFLGGGKDGPGGAEFAAFKKEHEGKVRFHASIADMPKPDGKMMAMVCTRAGLEFRRLTPSTSVVSTRGGRG